jgi:hypothetical protein
MSHLTVRFFLGFDPSSILLLPEKEVIKNTQSIRFVEEYNFK